MSFRRLIAYNTLVQISGKALGIFISLATVIFLTRYLGTAGFGQYNTALIFVGFFIILGDLGIYNIVVRQMAQQKSQRVEIFGNIFLYRLSSAFLMVMIAFFIGFLMPYEPIVKLAIGIVALQSFFGLLTRFLGSIFQINYRMDLPTFAEVFSRAIYFCLILLAIHLRFSLLGIFWFLLIGTVANFCLVYWLSFKFIKLKLKFNWQLWQTFIRESWPLGLVTTLAMIGSQIGPILLSLLKPVADLGIYSSAHRIFENLIIIPIIFVDLVFPKLAALFKNNILESKKFFEKIFNILLITVLPVAIFLIFMAPHLIGLVAGEDFIAGALTLKILSFALVFIFLSYPLSQLLVAAGKQKWLILNITLFIVTTIILNLILIPKYTYNGVALAMLIATGIYFLSLLVFCYFLITIRPNFNLTVKLILPAVITIVFLHLLLKISFFSPSQFALFSLIKQMALVLLASVLIGGVYWFSLTTLKIIPHLDRTRQDS